MRLYFADPLHNSGFCQVVVANVAVGVADLPVRQYESHVVDTFGVVLEKGEVARLSVSETYFGSAAHLLRGITGDGRAYDPVQYLDKTGTVDAPGRFAAP